jgi:hypothetical protein
MHEKVPKLNPTSNIPLVMYFTPIGPHLVAFHKDLVSREHGLGLD